MAFVGVELIELWFGGFWGRLDVLEEDIKLSPPQVGPIYEPSSPAVLERASPHSNMRLPACLSSGRQFWENYRNDGPAFDFKKQLPVFAASEFETEFP